MHLLVVMLPVERSTEISYLKKLVRFEILKVAKMSMLVFWVVTL
jgi:hypothetical protein